MTSLYVESKKKLYKWTYYKNELTYLKKRETHRQENTFTVARGKDGGKG